MAEWFEDESFWADLYPVMFNQARLDAAAEQVDQILALAGVRSGDVLDLCCGPGRHSVELAARGFRVTGVDRTRFLLDKARERGREADVEVEWVGHDMREFVRQGSFDLVLSMFTSFGYFDDKDEDVRVLRNIHASLRDGGVFLIDVLGKEYLARVFMPTTSQVGDDGSVMVERHEVFDDWSRVRNQWTLIKQGRARTWSFHHTIYSAQELRDRILGVGFGDVTVYGALDGRPYDTQALRLVAVATK